MPDEDILEIEDEDDPDLDPDESLEEPDLQVQIDSLKAELESRQNKELDDLRRSVGRVQSLVDKFDKASAEQAESLRQQVQDQFGGVSNVLNELVANMDETVLSPEVKQRVLTAQAQAQQAAQEQERKRETEAMIQEAVKGLRPEQQQMTQVSAIEASIVEEIESYGLDPDDFDWREAADVYRQNSSEKELRSYFRDKIKSAVQEQGTATRRQRRKENSKEPPGSTGASGDVAAELEKLMDSGDLDKANEILRSMGVNT